MPAKPTARRAAALAGYRVLELDRPSPVVLRPAARRLRCEVIKVEAADGDPVRSMGKRYRDKSLWARAYPQQIADRIDLRKPRGQELVKTLTRSAIS